MDAIFEDRTTEDFEDCWIIMVVQAILPQSKMNTSLYSI